MSSSDDSLDIELDSELFQEPPGYFLPPLPYTSTKFTLISGQAINLRLVGHNPLWGHHLWNAASSITTYLQDPNNTKRLVTGKPILELGAGAGLPSLAASILEASQVVVTDYPDAELIENLAYNVANSGLTTKQQGKVAVEGHSFGTSPRPLLSHLPPNIPKFSTLILADLLFNHHCHASLLSTVQSTLAHSEDARALVFFTPYRPWLLEKDMDFFRLAECGGFVVEKVGVEMAEKVMFGEDEGVSKSSRGVSTRKKDVEWKDETLRRTIFRYELRWKEEELQDGDD